MRGSVVRRILCEFTGSSFLTHAFAPGFARDFRSNSISLPRTRSIHPLIQREHHSGSHSIPLYTHLPLLPFATVRHRATRTRNCVSRPTFPGLAFKLIEEAEKSWNRIRGADKIGLLLSGEMFKDGIQAQDNPPERLCFK